MAEFRIEYTIQRIDDGDDDYRDVGFGSSGGWSTINGALYAIESDVQNRQWETEPHMPDPDDAEGDLVPGSSVRDCWHPRSCSACDRRGASCGRHHVGEPGHEKCTGSSDL